MILIINAIAHVDGCLLLVFKLKNQKLNKFKTDFDFFIASLSFFVNISTHF